jgi:hypothetical protein
VRQIGRGGFAFIPNRFLHDGFFAALPADELLLYFALVLAGDRQGQCYYHYDSLCALLCWPVERYLSARNALIDKDMVAFDGRRFQVLELPKLAPAASRALRSHEDLEANDGATIRSLIERSLREADEKDCG